MYTKLMKITTFFRFPPKPVRDKELLFELNAALSPAKKVSMFKKKKTFIHFFDFSAPVDQDVTHNDRFGFTFEQIHS